MRLKAKKAIALFMVLAVLLPCVPAISFAAGETYQTRDVRIWYNGALTSITTDEDGTTPLSKYQTEHFQIIYGNSGANSAKVNTAFLQKCETVLENCWALYIDKMGMEPTSTSVKDGGDKVTQYKTNAVLMGTGVPGYSLGANDWGAYGSVDEDGYPYFMCSLSAMDSPTVVAHEYGHAVHYAQGDNAWKNDIYLGPWFEAVANWFAEQYIYEYIADTTQLSHLYLRAGSLTKMNGRAYYEAWPILQYLTEDPDATGVYGKTFVQQLLSCDLSTLKGTDTLFWEVLEKCNGDSLTTADTVGMYASHMATMDFEHKNLYNKTINSAFSGNYFFYQQRYTVMDELGEEANTYSVPIERAPQAMGYNIIPLDFTPGEVSVTLNALTDAAGAGWRARLVKESSGVTSYTDLFKEGETMTIQASSGDSLYLTVAATPEIESMVRHTIGGWADHSTETNMPYENKTRYPYSVTLSGAVPMTPPAPSGTFNTHANGGGKVASTASVAQTAYVGPNAVVMGSAQVTDNAVIDGYAIVGGSAKISGNAYVGDTAVVFGSAQVTDNARVIESACIYANYKVSGSSVVKGMSLGLKNGGVSGEAITYGDWFEDGGYSAAGGRFSGYHSLSSDSAYSIVKPENINYRPYAYHLRTRYEFNGSLDDTYADTDLYGVNNPVLTDNSITFNGNNYAVLDSSVLYYDKAKITLSAKGTGTLLSIGDGAIELSVNNGTASLGTASVTYEETDFNDIEIELDGTNAVLRVNGAENTGAISKTLFEAARSGKHYVGKGFNGSVDYLRISDMSYVYDKEAGVMNEALFTKALDSTGSLETGTLNSKTSDTASAWYGWSSTNASAVTVDGGLNITGNVNATIKSPAVQADKFVIEFTPEGGNAYPDCGILDADGTTVLFSHRYATDASQIHVGRGETNSAVRGTASLTDTAGQARLTNFIGERLCSGTILAERGALKFSDGERVRIVVENASWSDDLAQAFSLSENYTDNLSAMTAGDAVYTVTYAEAENDNIMPVSVSVYKGHVTGFGGFKTAGGASGVTVSYKDLVIYSGDEKNVTIKYTIGGKTVATVDRSYNPKAGDTGAVFEDLYESENGSNYLYHAEGQTYSESRSVEMTQMPSNDGYSIGTHLQKDGVDYITLSSNLIPNGDFKYGLKGWYNSAGGGATDEYFTVNDDGTVTARAHTGADGKGSLYRAWDIEKGKTYMFLYKSNTANSYHKTSQKDDISATGDGTVIGTSAAGDNSFVFTATKEYLQINFRWLNSSDIIGSFALYEVKNTEADVNVIYKDESGATLGSAVEKSHIDSKFTAGYSVNDNFIVIESGEQNADGGYGYLARLISSDTITVAESGNEVTAVVKPIYKLKSKNLLPGGEEPEKWTVGKGADDFSVQSVYDANSNSEYEANSNITETSEKTHSGSKAIKSNGVWDSFLNNGWNGKHSIAMYADVNPSSKYYFAGAFYPGDAKGTEATVATLSESGKPKTMQGRTDGEKELANGGITSWNGTENTIGNTNGSGSGKFFANMNGKWNQLEYVLSTDASSKGFAALFYFLSDCGTSYFDDFMLYEVEPLVDEHTITVHYQYNGKDIAAGENIVLTGLEATSVTAPAKEIVTDNGIYRFDAATFTVGAADREEMLEPSSAAEIESGMLANYNFADTVTDALGSYDAEVITKTNGDLVFDKNGFVTFPGQTKTNVLGSYIKLPNSLLSAMNKNYTISMWVKPENYTNGVSGGNVRIFDLGAGSAYNSIFLQRTSSDGWLLRDRGGNSSSNTYNRTDHLTATFTPETSTVGSWTLVTVSVDTENKTATVYFNGEAKITDTSWQTESTPANVINFSSDVSKYMPTLGAGMWALDREGGTTKSTNDPEYKGGMADVRFYSRALTAEEVKLLLPAHKTVTVSYTADGAKIQDDTTVDYFLDEASFEVPVKITKDGTVYKLRGSTADDGSVTLTSSGETYTAVYDAENTKKSIAVRYVDGSGNVLQTGETQDYVPGAEVITIGVSENYYLKGDDGAYIVKCSRAQSYTTDNAVNGFIDVELDIVKKYAAVSDGQMQIGDAFTETNTFNWACLSGTDYQGANKDDDGVSRTEGLVSTFGASRYNLMSFKLPTEAERNGKAVLLKVPVINYQTNAVSGSGHHEASLVAYIDNWDSAAVPAACKTADAGSPIFMAEGNFAAENNTTKAVNGYVTFDVTEAVNAANGAVISFSIRTTNGGIRIADSSAAGLNGTTQGMAAYLDIVDAKTVSVTGNASITKNGTRMAQSDSVIVSDGSYINLTTDDADNIFAFVDAGNTVYVTTDGKLKLYGSDITGDINLTGKTFGVSMANGAQVRVGAGVGTDGKIATSTTDLKSSGLRFIATKDMTQDSIAKIDGAVVGVRIKPENSDQEVFIEAKQYQSVADGVFTVALVNLSESNYNRVFHAVPYVQIGGTRYFNETDVVSRSIYEVAAGILVRSSVEGNTTGYETYKLTQNVADVLNAYVNQVGIRLTLDKSSETLVAPRTGESETGRYVGGKSATPDVFFDVSAENISTETTTIYKITITAPTDEQGNTNVKFATFWQDYLRINNNNAFVKANIVTDETNTNDTQIVFTFYPNGIE